LDVSPTLAVGDEFDLEVIVIAHGGHAIGHHAGRTIFVRHAIPGERVHARVTEVTRKIVRADAIDILTPSTDRVAPPCRFSGPGQCGGCDFQHVTVDRQRSLKTEVLRSSLERFAGLTEADLGRLDPRVLELPGHPDGLRWRSRIRWSRGQDGLAGLRQHRGHRIIPVDHCLIVREDRDAPTDHVPARMSSRVRERTWSLASDGFWQVHEALPEALVDLVLRFGDPKPGERWWDLYSGAGLFAAFLAEQVGETGQVIAVEGDRGAVDAGRRALADLRQVTFRRSDVARWIAEGDHRAPEGVVLDPPRAGAGKELMAALGGAGIPCIVYVACDPVALARDISVLLGMGHRLDAVVGLDAFPMTHHFETVALLSRT